MNINLIITLTDNLILLSQQNSYTIKLQSCMKSMDLSLIMLHFLQNSNAILIFHVWVNTVTCIRNQNVFPIIVFNYIIANLKKQYIFDVLDVLFLR